MHTHSFSLSLSLARSLIACIVLADETKRSIVEQIRQSLPISTVNFADTFAHLHQVVESFNESISNIGSMEQATNEYCSSVCYAS
jgi:hypothetical protein